MKPTKKPNTLLVKLVKDQITSNEVSFMRSSLITLHAFRKEIDISY